MTEQFEQDKPEEVKLIVTEDMRSYIYDITKWAKFISIVGFIVSILMFMVASSTQAIMNSNPNVAAQMNQLGSNGSTVITVIYCVFALVLFYISILLNKIAKRAKQGVLYGDQESLNESFASLKSLFKFWGIITIVGIAFMFLSRLLVGAAI